jgi:hypothetical protein
VLQVEGVERIPRGPHSHAMVAPPALVRQPPNSDTGRGLAISPVPEQQEAELREVQAEARFAEDEMAKAKATSEW